MSRRLGHHDKMARTKTNTKQHKTRIIPRRNRHSELFIYCLCFSDVCIFQPIHISFALLHTVSHIYKLYPDICIHTLFLHQLQIIILSHNGELN